LKISITADVHLSSYEETPERYHALEDIILQSLNENIHKLWIIGDLFHANFDRYSDFENLAKKYPDMTFQIIPGNHDSTLSSRSLAGQNIRVFDEPAIITEDYQFLILPYRHGKTMGELIAERKDQLLPKNWILLSHGDWLDGRRSFNAIESGTYMPLTRSDLERYQPARVFLGHIHAPSDGPVFYPGSPCGLDITETGLRRFLIYDPQTNTVESREIDTDFLYQQCSIFVIPVDDEADSVRQMASEIKRKWNIREKDRQKTRIRVQASGYTRNKSELLAVLLEEFETFPFYKNESPNIEKVSVTIDENRIKIAQSVKERIDALELNCSPDEPDRDQILMEAFQLIFKE
jgi:DNA repair exonuclease SbcCD nuclease subunit